VHHITAARVGARIRDLRSNAGLSQTELEARSGISKARLSRYENGHVMPTVQTVDKIAAALGSTLSEFLRGIS
jgi:transcriptional regulator with XRE-family HTH domain